RPGAAFGSSPGRGREVAMASKPRTICRIPVSPSDWREPSPVFITCLYSGVLPDPSHHEAVADLLSPKDLSDAGRFVSWCGELGELFELRDALASIWLKANSPDSPGRLQLLRRLAMTVSAGNSGLGNQVGLPPCPLD